MILLFAQAKTDLFFIIVSLSVHTLPPAMLESLDPCSTEALILVPEKTSFSAAITSSSDR